MSKRKQLMVSLLKSMYDTHPEHTTLDAIYQFLILDTLRVDTERHRYYKSVGMKKEAQSTKEKMLNFTPSVLLSGGKSERDITDYTGLGLCDFDYVPVADLSRCLALLDADPYVVLAYVTISGEGVRVIYLTDVTDVQFHSAVFEQGNAYYSKLLGYPSDKQCCNVARTSILCYCPQAIYHSMVEPMHINLEVPSKKKSTSCKSSARKVTALIAEEVVLAQLEQEGKTYTEGHYNEYLSAALYLMNRYGVEQQQACQWATQRFADYDASQVASIARSVYLHTEEHGVLKLSAGKKSRFSYASLPEIEKFISSQGLVRNNVVTNRCEIKLNGEQSFRDISDRDENTLWVRANKAGVYCGPRTMQMVLNSEYVPNFNPFTDYIYGLAPWDGQTDYIGQLCSTVQTSDPELFCEYFRKWLVGMVASLVNPDVVNHEVLVFIGEQGRYKTCWMSHLLPPEWSRYFYTKTNSKLSQKDDIIALSQYALFCFEEIDHMSISEMNKFKAMVSMPSVNERAAYARNITNRPHLASYCGTGNNLAFLNDPTGTRRWLVFEILSIDNPYAAQWPYQGIYAQALALYRSGFRYWFDLDEIIKLSRHNERFEVPCMEQELVMMYYRNPRLGEHGVFVSTAEIMQRINALIKIPLSITILGMAMRKAGFQSCRSNNVRGYRVVELTQQEIEQRKQNIDQPSCKTLPF